MKLTLIILAVLITSQYTHSAACPLSSDTGVSAGNGTCDVTDATTGTTIQLNFNSGFDSTTLIENDNVAALATDNYLNTDFAATVVADSAAAPGTSRPDGFGTSARQRRHAMPRPLLQTSPADRERRRGHRLGRLLSQLC